MTTALASGSIYRNGPRQIYRPQPIILATNSGAGESVATITVKMPIPSSQTREKGSVIFYPSSGPLGDIHGIGTIWVSACEEDQKGISGSGGILVPVTDLEGTSVAPTAFPKTNGLGGYAREFVTPADWIQFVIGIPSINAEPGIWVFQSLIQPDSVLFDWESWDEIRRLFTPQLAGPTAAL